VLFAGYALAVATLGVGVGVAIGIGWEIELSRFVTSPMLFFAMLALTMLWAAIIRKRLS